jgi:hypothetical protein
MDSPLYGQVRDPDEPSVELTVAGAAPFTKRPKWMRWTRDSAICTSTFKVKHRRSSILAVTNISA